MPRKWAAPATTCMLVVIQCVSKMTSVSARAASSLCLSLAKPAMRSLSRPAPAAIRSASGIIRLGLCDTMAAPTIVPMILLPGARSARPRLLDRPPDPLRRRRHVERLHAERCQGVEHGIHHGRQRAHRARLAGAFHAERIELGRDGIVGNRDVAEIIGA